MKINQELNKAETLKLNMGSTDKLHPAFCFRYLHNDYDIDKLLLAEDKNIRSFLSKLNNLSKITWQEIMRSSRYKNGTEIINSKQIKKPLPKEITPDMNILVFHLQDLFRLIGVRDGKVFYTLFIDINGELYNH